VDAEHTLRACRHLPARYAELFAHEEHSATFSLENAA
jgi:hypothetical protein